MILTDAGVLIALFEPREINNHQRCLSTFRQTDERLLTTLACVTEAMYFLGSLKGWPGQKNLWKLLASDSLQIFDLDSNDLSRMTSLMEKYRDVPMDFADASLVVAAERLNLRRVFTIDSDFHIYRINGKKSFEVIP